MKQRRPWIHYLLVWLTGGLFWFAWPFLMARDINTASRHHLPRLAALTGVYCGILLLYLGLVAYQIHRVATYNVNDEQPFYPASALYVALLLALAFLLFAVPAYLVAKTSGFLRARRRPALGPRSSVVLFALYGISLPMLQGKLNEEWKAQPNSAVNADVAP
jgi:hypothetical protein